MKLKIFLPILLFTTSLLNAQPAIQFQKTYGGSFGDNDIKAEIVTSDGGYMLAGILSYADASLIKLDATGNLVWKKTYGGTGNDKFYSVQQTADGGFIVAGGTSSSDNDVSGQHGTAGDGTTDIWVVKVNAIGAIVWQKCYGGTGSEAYDNASIVKTSDGGYIIASSSNSTDGDITGNHAGSTDCVVIKTDVNGNILWEKTLGGSGNDVASTIKQTTDGGYIIGATSDSKDGDVTGNHGLDDLWIIKLTSTGAITWQKCFGGTLTERYPSLQQTSDGGYIVAGLSTSNDGDVSGNHGNTDFWVIKLDPSGGLTWQKALGGSGEDDPAAIIQTSDGGYIATGQNYSNDGDVSGHTGPTFQPDAWVVKLNSTGGVTWQQSMDGLGNTSAYGRDIKETGSGFTMAGVTYSRGYYAAGDYWLVNFDNTGNITWQVKNGASGGNDYSYSGQQTSDGGYIIAGDVSSTNGDVTGAHGGYDWWIVKTNSSGAIQWQKALGGSADDYCYSIEQTSDGGFIAAGYTASTDGDVTVNHGVADCWVVKLDASGNIVWQKSFGGTLVDYANYIQQTSDGGYIMAGVTGSNNGDVSVNHGLYDYWIVKLDASGNIVWQKTFGGTGYDYAYSIKPTTDGGYIVAGDENSTDGDVTNNKGNYDAWIIKMDGSGTLQWQKTFGGTDYDYMKSIKQTSDGGYVAGGYEGSIDGDVTGNHGSYDFWALKLDASGTLQWQKTMGGSGQDYAYTMQTTSDGGIVFFGDSPSNDGDVTNNHQPTGYQGKYDYWIVKLSSIALPVTLLNFEGILQNNAAILKWSTATEINDKGFEVQKSADGQSFSNIGFVAGAGNSSLRHDYTFSDANLVNGSNYYRLQQKDLDGKISYSSIIRIDFTKFDWSVLNNASNQSRVQFQLDKTTNVIIQVISLNGTIIRTINKGKIGAGTYSIPLYLSNEASGIYMIKLTANDKSYIKRIVK